MKARVSTKIGDATYTFAFDEGKDMDILHHCAVLGNPPIYCNECKNNQYFRLDSNKDKEGNIYVNVVCKKCGAKAKLGQYKVGGYFWHKFEKYQKDKDVSNETTNEDIPPIEEINEPEALPF